MNIHEGKVQAGWFVPHLVADPEDRFSRNKGPQLENLISVFLTK